MGKAEARLEYLNNTVQAVLQGAGINPADAEFVADSLIDAEIRGVESHGLMRLESYIERINKKLINVHPNISVVNENGSIIQVNGDNGLGQVITKKALDICMERADESAIAFATIKNTNHFGTAGYYSRLAACKGYIAFAASNASPTMPPFGGIDPLLGTNPFAVSFPAGKYNNFTLDIAMSAVAKGKIRLYEKEGKEIPLGWAMDSLGNDTANPTEAINGGLLPMGGYKGYGLAMIVDLLCGLISGAKLSFETESMFASDSISGIGHFLGVIKIDKLMPIDIFEQKVENWFETLKGSKTRPGVTEIFIPGEIENQKKKNVGESILVLDKTLDAISNLYNKISLNEAN